jgi:hypothetical protein
MRIAAIKAGIGVVQTQLPTVFNQRDQAEVTTDREREELMALYTSAQALAVDIISGTVEYFFRKDHNPASRRVKCQRWGVVYFYEPGKTSETPPKPPAPSP